MKLTNGEKAKFNLPLDWRDPTIDPNIEERIELPKPKRDPMTKYKWLVGIVLVVLFLLASSDDLKVAESDAEYYRNKVEAGVWPAERR